MATFEEVATTGKGRSTGCPRCGTTPNAGQVSLQLLELGPDGSLRGGRRITSRSVSMCESCAVDVYKGLLAELEP